MSATPSTREQLHRLVDELPEAAVEELIVVPHQLATVPPDQSVEVVTDPEEDAMVLESLAEDPDEPTFTLEEAKAFLAHHRSTYLQ